MSDEIVLICRQCRYVGPVVVGKRRLRAYAIVFWALLGVLTIGMVPLYYLFDEGSIVFWLIAAAVFALLVVLEVAAGFGRELVAKCPACLAELGSLSGLTPLTSGIRAPDQPTRTIEQESEWSCECGTTNRAGARHCKSCGKGKPTTKRKCKECGAVNDRDAKFCDECGVEMLALDRPSKIRPNTRAAGRTPKGGGERSWTFQIEGDDRDSELGEPFACFKCQKSVPFGASRCAACGANYVYGRQDGED